MATSGRQTNRPVYQLKVTLKGSKPPIWRRVQVPGNTILSELHGIIQVAMGWENCHLYQFEIGGRYFSDPVPEWGDQMKDAGRTRLNQVVTRGKTKFAYDYDFGDGWQHEILVEKIQPAEAGVPYPSCLSGKRACPPEDCGGIWGYADLLEIINDPEHEEYEERIEWLGDGFDPEAFDVNEVNGALIGMR